MTHVSKALRLSAIIVLIGTLFCCGKDAVKTDHDIDIVHFNSATMLARSLRRGNITSTELLNLYIERIQRYNDDINAVVALDVATARKRAAEADEALAQGQVWGPLHGVPMTVKDVFEVAGMPATSGDPMLKDYTPKRNATAVQRLIDAGAIIFGKTNVPYHAMDIQTYNEIYGTTNNPWNLSRTPGGSSGGSAAALAAGFTPLELGSDLAGSVRFPAHYTGVFGHKPTFGIVPRYGHIPPMPGRVPKHRMPMIPLFVVGPLARSADDLALALDVLTTADPTDADANKHKLLPPRKQKFKEYRVAVWLTDPDPAAEIDAEVSATLERAVAKLRDAGLEVDEDARPDTKLWEDRVIWLQLYNQMMAGLLPLDEILVEKQKNQQKKWAEFFKRYDVLLVPVAPTVAFPHDHEGTLLKRGFKINGQEKPMLNNMTWTYSAIAIGLPATVAPVGLSDSGLPVGIQIIGARFEDRTTIAFARGLAELTGGFKAPPGYGD